MGQGSKHYSTCTAVTFLKIKSNQCNPALKYHAADPTVPGTVLVAAEWLEFLWQPAEQVRPRSRLPQLLHEVIVTEVTPLSHRCGRLAIIYIRHARRSTACRASTRSTLSHVLLKLLLERVLPVAGTARCSWRRCSSSVAGPALVVNGRANRIHESVPVWAKEERHAETVTVITD